MENTTMSGYCKIPGAKAVTACCVAVSNTRSIIPPASLFSSSAGDTAATVAGIVFILSLLAS
ncbi:hypothetical protein [Sporomusa termitida]|uniref:hypothetical protein n=1 Tax=Sporomusa termitida TaxID=2377 RepID=UPI0011871246|nr:hypothetical protein [Sporomusa termitida]